MEEQDKPNSRSTRYEKRRKGIMMVTLLLSAAALLIVVYIAVMIFGGSNQAGNANQTEKASTQETTDAETSKEASEEESSKDLQVNEDKSKENDSDNNEDESKDKEKEEEEGTVTESDDENVDRVITKDWEPVPTEQATDGSHSILYKENTQDWAELKQAVSKATGLSEDDMITWFIGNNGSPSKAVATVSNKAQSEIYRVNIEWVEGEGYKPTQLEVLNTNPYK